MRTLLILIVLILLSVMMMNNQKDIFDKIVVNENTLTKVKVNYSMQYNKCIAVITEQDSIQVMFKMSCGDTVFLKNWGK